MIGNQVTAHTGSTKNKTYKLVTATITGYTKKPLGPNHYVLMYDLTDADGATYQVAESRIVETITVATEAEKSEKVETAQILINGKDTVNIATETVDIADIEHNDYIVTDLGEMTIATPVSTASYVHMHNTPGTDGLKTYGVTIGADRKLFREGTTFTRVTDPKAYKILEWNSVTIPTYLV